MGKNNNQNLHKLPLRSVKNIVRTLLKDPVLKDIKWKKIRSDYEIERLISRENGTSIKVKLIKQNGQVIPLQICKSAKLDQLKEEIQIQLNQINLRKTNWRYIWRNYCLVVNGVRLLDRKITIDKYLQEDSEIFFSKYIIQREKRKHRKKK